jgi:hypothetical protein
MMRGCKYLDHDESHYPRCKLITLDDDVKYWDRFEGGFVTQTDLDRFPQTATKVQFCGKGKGRINGIFQCYNPAEMSCYE